jgi:hypothetical protein
MIERAQYQLDIVVEHLTACETCSALLNASTAKRDPAVGAAFRNQLAQHLASDDAWRRWVKDGRPDA